MPHKHDFPKIAEAKKRYAHGTHARYVLAKCRCDKCRQAARDYERNRTALRAPWVLAFTPTTGRWVVRHRVSGEVRYRCATKETARNKAERLNAKQTQHSPNALIPVVEVRNHIAWLQSQGVGVKTIAREAKIACSVLNRIIDGNIARTRRSNAAKVLALKPLSIVRGGARVRADETFVLLERLVKAGYRKGWIAQKLGAQCKHLQIGKATTTVSVKHAREVHKLYLRLQKRDLRIKPISKEFRLGVLESTFTRSGRTKSTKHPVATPSEQSVYPHGTRARYTENNCRCRRCAAAQRAFEAAQEVIQPFRYALREIRTGGWVVRDVKTGKTVFHSHDRKASKAIVDEFNSNDPVSSKSVLIDATPARNHLQALSAAGLSQGIIASAAGTSNPAHVWHIMHGKSKRVQKRIAEALLAVDERGLPATAPIDAASTWTCIERLLAVGFELRWINTLLGFAPSYFRYRSKRIRVDRARAVMALYGSLRERITALRDLEAARAA